MAVKTRCNSQFQMLQDFVYKDSEKMEASISEHNKAEKLTIVEAEVLKESLNVFECFLEATLMTEGDKPPTLNAALPLLLSIINLQQKQMGQTKHCGNLIAVIAGLLISIYKRFNGLLQLINFSAVCGPPFYPEENDAGS